MANANMHAAKRAKNDEFYTQITDIENELRHYKDHFKDKVVFENQNGVCIKCTKNFKIEEMEADHITPWSKGGQTIVSNCQMLCKKCNRTKSNI